MQESCTHSLKSDQMPEEGESLFLEFSISHFVLEASQQIDGLAPCSINPSILHSYIPLSATKDQGFTVHPVFSLPPIDTQQNIAAHKYSHLFSGH